MGGAWWAAVYGVAQSQTRLKRLSSSSNIYSTQSLLKSLRTLLNSLYESNITLTPKLYQRHYKKTKSQSEVLVTLKTL